MTLFQATVTSAAPYPYVVTKAIGIEINRLDLYTIDTATITITIGSVVWFSVDLTAGDLYEVLCGIPMTLGVNEIITFSTTGATANSLRVRMDGK